MAVSENERDRLAGGHGELADGLPILAAERNRRSQDNHVRPRYRG